ncbi:MAG TPA: cysteine desulfurase NifS [Verrucomicrobia bacterium]|jgi:cysteine desulfurase|nr:cysteine desulfurase NifS [Pedosphaera sp.]HIM23825.1 cysteine desulfurase NifS [Verrucomicrobiota bacterium]|tara:strand:+ start:1019 stop:2215 length:1197 start_codon:yes stop_codon:yes gene_type:complete
MSNERLVYLDNNATTRVAPEVVEAMLPCLTEHWGNPSSAYDLANAPARMIESARGQVARLIGTDPRNIVFTSCGTESNNAAIQSALHCHPTKRHVITSAVEHSANIKLCHQLEKRGYEATFLPVDLDGGIDLCDLQAAIRPDTAIVSIMWANNETGVLFPVEELAAICRSHDVLFHTDAIQVAGKLPIDVQKLGVDFLSLSAHKLRAPKGIGLLYVKPNTPFQPYIIGGGQERGQRGGTENVANIVAFGKAAELALGHIDVENTRVRALRDKLERGILQTVRGSVRNGGGEPRLPNTTNIGFDGVEAEAILLLLDREGICASSGSACTTGSIEPSHVLQAMGVPLSRSKGSLRFSLGRDNTEADVDCVLEKLPAIVSRLRDASPEALGQAEERLASAG